MKYGDFHFLLKYIYFKNKLFVDDFYYILKLLTFLNIYY